MQQFSKQTFLTQDKAILIDDVSIMRKEFNGQEVGFDAAYDESIFVYKSEFIGKVGGVISMYHDPNKTFVPEFTLYTFNFTWVAKGKEDSYDGAYDFKITPIMSMVNVLSPRPWVKNEEKNTSQEDMSPFVFEFIQSMAWEALVRDILPKLGVDEIPVQRATSPGLCYINEEGHLSYTKA